MSHVPWDLRGKTVLVTGATSGIGLGVATELARRGAHLTLVGRDPGRLEAVRARVSAVGTAGPVTTLLCDFSSQASIRALAADFRARHDRLQVLINNAGGVNERRRLTVDGIEATFAVNHLGYFLLTDLLLDLLVASAPARIVTVASISHRRGTLDFDDLGFERGYWILKAYQRSKLANVLFAAELARRLAGTGVTSNSVHPGSLATNIWSGAPRWAQPLIRWLYRPFVFEPLERGVARVVQLAAAPELTGVTGAYFERGRPVPPSPLARDPELARRLWEVSAGLVGRAGTSARPAGPG